VEEARKAVARAAARAAARAVVEEAALARAAVEGAVLALVGTLTVAVPMVEVLAVAVAWAVVGPWVRALARVAAEGAPVSNPGQERKRKRDGGED
jgi:hypothetical protein